MFIASLIPLCGCPSKVNFSNRNAPTPIPPLLKLSTDHVKKKYGKITGTRKSFIEVTKKSVDRNVYAIISVMIT